MDQQAETPSEGFGQDFFIQTEITDRHEEFNPPELSKEYSVVTRQREPDLSRSGTGTCNFCRQTTLHSKTLEGVNPNTY